MGTRQRPICLDDEDPVPVNFGVGNALSSYASSSANRTISATDSASAERSHRNSTAFVRQGSVRRTFHAQSTPHQTVITIEDEFARVSLEPQESRKRKPSDARYSRPKKRQQLVSAEVEVIDLDDPHQTMRFEGNHQPGNLIDITSGIGEDEVGVQPARALKQLALVRWPLREVQSFSWFDQILRAEKTVELENGSFLYVKHVLQDQADLTTKLKGYLLLRCRSVPGLRRSLNELVFIHDIYLDVDPDNPQIIQVGVEDVLKVRKLIRTNRRFPECRFDKDEYPPDDAPFPVLCNYNVKQAEERAELCVRWKFVTVYHTARDHQKEIDCPTDRKFYKSKTFAALGQEECSQPLLYYAVQDEVKRVLWRGETIRGGSHSFVRIQRQQYTYADIFCGSGGATRGASDAGLRIMYGVDFWSVAGETWRENFPRAQFHEMSVHDFIQRSDLHLMGRIDVLHISPPCQPHSAIHVREGRNDEANTASLFSIKDLLEKVKPRFITLEQTSGIVTHNKIPGAYNALIREFTDAGCSVISTVVPFQNFGLPQTRKRLIVIAAGPGEILPPFPNFTHGNALGKSFTTPLSVLRNIQRNAPNHVIRPPPPGRVYTRWDGSQLIPCITCDGGTKCCLPDGSRGLTERELAALTGYPDYHVFKGTMTAIRKQIGNSVPPMCAEVIFRDLIKHMKRVDGVE